MSELNIPEKCLNCPMVIRPTGQIEKLDTIIDRGIQTVMSDKPDAVGQETYTLLQDIDDDELPEDITPEVLAKGFRHEVSAKVEAIKQLRDSLEAELGRRVLNCYGPATIEGYAYPRHYEVTLCQSPIVTDQSTEITVVKRTR
jgi:hypothetical protein